MEKKFLSPFEFWSLQALTPKLDDPLAHEGLVRTIGSYESRVLALLPEELQPEHSWIGGTEALRDHSEFIGREVARLLELPVQEQEIEKRLGIYYLSEVMCTGMGRRIWRSSDGERIYDYDLGDHGDTSIGCIRATDGIREILSFSQSVYPFALSLLAFAKEIDPSGEKTIRAWDWQEPFFEGSNPWKHRPQLIPYEENGGFHALGNGLYEGIPERFEGKLSFGTKNGKACYPILDRQAETLHFYLEHPQGDSKIGNMGMFQNVFAIHSNDQKNMFAAACHLVARDWREVLYAIMEYFPEYYREASAQQARR